MMSRRWIGERRWRCGASVLEPYNPAYTARWVEKTEVEALHVIVYSRRRGVLTDDIERVAVER